ncbi:MAG: phenylphosphate carboxylase subunit delta [Thermoanaerobaculia bacterium]
MTVDVKQIRIIVSDVDGVWTDGKIIYSGDHREIKEFNVRDGLGVKLAQRAGIEVAVITSRRSKALDRRCRELGVREVVQGAREKMSELRKILEARSLGFESLCYIGDDLPDLAAIEAAALSAAPADAVAEIRAVATWTLACRGGEGAFRELVERILRERGEWDGVVDEYRAAKIARS